jgi:citrate synthase
LPAAYGNVVAEQSQATPLQLAILALSLMELDNPRAYDLSPDGYARSGVAILRTVGAILLGGGQPSAEPLHEFIIRQTGASPHLADLVRRLLVLAADHELDPTAYAVRAAANTGVTPYAAMIAGLVSSSGRRLTFGRADKLARFFEEVMASSDPREVVLGRTREGEAVPGFQSKNYPQGDPRARAMLAALREELGDDPELKMFDRLVEAAFETLGAHPDFVLVSAFLSRKIGLDRRHGSLVRVARVAGWIAHALEQYHGRDLVRPHAPYAGRLPAAASA